MSTSRFLSTMMLASGISMWRIFVIAVVLEPAAFGTYAISVAAGAFAALLLSFGLIEQTIKTYPRLWSEGHPFVALYGASATARTLFIRFVLVIGPVAALAALLGKGGVVGAAVAGVGLSTALASLYASVHRATTDVASLGVATLLRAVSAVGLAALGALIFGWPGAVLGEVLAGLLGAFVSRQYSTRLARNASKHADPPDMRNAALTDLRAGRMWLFLGFLIAAAPAFLDRSFVAAHFGASAAGTYAFLILFVTGANAFVGIVAQKVGPLLVQMERFGKSPGEQARYAFRWMGRFWLMWFAGMIFLFTALHWGPLALLAHKYRVTDSQLAAITVFGCMQPTAMLDFLLLSRDVERSVFAASFGYFVAALVACGVTLVFNLSLTSLIWLWALAKMVHLGVQIALILQMHSRYQSSHSMHL